MRNALLTVFVGLLGLVPATVAVTQGSRPPAETPPENPFDDSQGNTDIFGRSTFEERSEQMDELIRGAWQLVAYHDIDGVILSSDVVGYALFVDGFMSIELHGALPETTILEDDFYITGTYRYKWDDAARLRLSTLIGSTNYNDFAVVEFIPPGTARDYEVRVDATSLELIRLDSRSGNKNSRFEFNRLQSASPRSLMKRDFYGRLVPVDEDEAEPARPPVRTPLPPRRQ